MWMDEEIRVELSLEQCLNRFRPLTPMGRDAAREPAPFLPGQEEAWNRLLDEQVLIRGCLSGHPQASAALREVLEAVPDPEETLRVLEAGESPTLSGWFRLKRFLWQTGKWNEWLDKVNVPENLRLDSESAALCDFILRLLNPDPPLKPSFSLDDGFDDRLGPLRQKIRKLEYALGERRRERSLAVERDWGVRPNRFGEWIVGRKTPLEAGFRQDPRLRLVRETPLDGVYALDDAPDAEWLDELAATRRELESVEREVLERLAPAVRPHVPALRGICDRLVHFDLQWARIRAADTWGGTRPLNDPHVFRMTGAVHPAVEASLRERGLSFAPLDLEVARGVTVVIGANMGGKTMALRTAGTVAALGQLGFFVPADSCRMPLFAWIGGVIGDKQDVRQGLSSFGAEVIRLRNCLRRTEPGLLLLDEVGRGTNPPEGAALARAVTEVLASGTAWSIHVTHFREALIPGVRGYRTAGLRREAFPNGEGMDERELLRLLSERMDFRLVPLDGEAEIPEEALVIAEALGLPADVIQRARRWRGEADRGNADG
ncbi:MutS-related protein [Staphylospora marina]|uniref:lysine 5,6-aminomutase reactivase ATPase KamC n=1 Tax=Staphylospora marina TaxID=2490858 RepID=UPI0013DDA180|nr:hypothetical protein [Staphylospora marina]